MCVPIAAVLSWERKRTGGEEFQLCQRPGALGVMLAATLLSRAWPLWVPVPKISSFNQCLAVLKPGQGNGMKSGYPSCQLCSPELSPCCPAQVEVMSAQVVPGYDPAVAQGAQSLLCKGLQT